MTPLKRGTTGIGVFQPKLKTNLGTLIRSARCFGADYVFTIGARYEEQQSAVGHDRHIPIFNFDTVSEFCRHVPDVAAILRVDFDADADRLPRVKHPDKAVYLLGAEDRGFDRMDTDIGRPVSIPSEWCLNVATAGSLVLYDRHVKQQGAYPVDTDLGAAIQEVV